MHEGYQQQLHVWMDKRAAIFMEWCYEQILHIAAVLQSNFLQLVISL